MNKRSTDLLQKTSHELLSLSPSQLQQLQKAASAQCDYATACKTHIDSIIAEKYSVRASAIRQSKAKESGFIRFSDDGISIVAEIAQKPQWDQKKLAEMAEKIIRAGDNPAEFMTITYDVPESRYCTWPTVLREQFSPARTLILTKQTFLLIDEKEGAS